MAHQVELEKTKYRNWVKGGLAYKYLKQGIEGFTDDVVVQEQTRILQNIKHTPGQTCNQCRVGSFKPKHACTGNGTCPKRLKICSCLHRKKKPCPNKVCDAIMEEILDSYDSLCSKPPTPNWNNTDIHKWCTDPWEIAKCFIHSPGYFNKSNASDIDAVGLLHILINNINLHSHLACTISANRDDVFSKTLRRRNAIFHSATMELEDSELNECIDDIIAILEDAKELKQRPCTQQAVEKLVQLKYGRFVITTNNEVAVCRDAMVSITNRSEELKQMIQDANDDIDQKKTEVSKVVDDKTREALEDALKQLETQNDDQLQTMKQTIQVLSERLMHIEADKNQDISAMKQDNSAMKQDISAMNQDNTAMKQDNSAMKQDNAAMIQDISAMKQDIAAMKQDNSAMIRDNSAMKQDNAAMKRDNSAMKRDNTAMIQDNAAMKQDNSAMKQDNAAMKQDSSAMKQDISAFKQDNSAFKQDISAIKQDNSAMKQDISAMKQDNSAIKQDNSAIKQDNSAMKQDISAMKQDNSAIKQDNSAIKLDIFLIQQRLTPIERSIEEQHTTRSAHKKQLEYVEQKQAVPEGYLQVGKIVYNPKEELGQGCDGTFVYKGKFDGRNVAVKRLLSQCCRVADREVDLLIKSDRHLNVVRYFCMEKDSQFIYIALELCTDTLASYIERKSSIDSITILYQAMSGLAHLHSLNIVHRDVKPENVLICQLDSQGKVKAMISDFGLGKKLVGERRSFSRGSGVLGTDGWIAPEMLNEKKNATCAVDIFTAGCVLYYAVTKGKHPFGDPLERQAKILAGDYNIRSLPLTDCYVRKQLIETMIDSNPDKRPSAKTVLKHPFFWSKETQLAFFLVVIERIQKESEDSIVMKKLEFNKANIVRSDWMKHIADELRDDLRKFRAYKGDSVRDLIKAIRNKRVHYEDLPGNVKNLLGTIPYQFVQYFTRLFPRLLIHTYCALECCAQEPMFQEYYDDSKPVLP